MLAYVLNHVTVPGLAYGDFLDLAAQLGSFLTGILRYITRSRYCNRFSFKTFPAAFQHILSKVYISVSCSLWTD